MWVVDIIENCITLWNSTLSSIWSMLTQSPGNLSQRRGLECNYQNLYRITGSRLRPARPVFCHEFL